MVRETLKKLKHSKSEVDVYSALDNICQKANEYRIYKFPPSDLTKGCVAFVMNWDEELENVMLKRKEYDDPEQKLCFEVTKVCEGVDLDEDKGM